MDALCKRFNIDNSKREKHSALVDCQLLKEVYINLLDQKSPKLNFNNNELLNEKINEGKIEIYKNKRKVVKPNEEEIKLHKEYLKTSLQKNFFS